MALEPAPSASRSPNPVAVAVLVIGVLLAAWVYVVERSFLRELLVLAGIVIVIMLVARLGWRSWQQHHKALSPSGLLGAFAATATGWLAVALVLWLKQTPSDNYIWILLWPFLMFVGFVAFLLGLGGVCLAIAVAVTAGGESTGRRFGYILGGFAAAAINVAHMVCLVRLLLTG